MRIYVPELFGRWFSLLAVCAAASLSSSDAGAASFNCGRASQPAEKAICANANLSSLDERTAGMYFLIVGSGTPARTVAQVNEAQSKFLQGRNACNANIDCLVDAYTSQMMYLRSIKSDLGL